MHNAKRRTVLQMTFHPLNVLITNSQAETGDEVQYLATLAKALQENGCQGLIG
jgi:hypothetical protein